MIPSRFRLRPAAPLLACAVLVFAPLRADDSAALAADRAALERVYHAHRLGDKRPFAEALPPAVIERFVRLDQEKENRLRQRYGIEISPAQIDAEVARINATTRAPAILAELRRALDDDPARFARALARPLVVDRELRARFARDDALHAPERRAAEQTRARLLAAEPVVALRDLVWQLAPRPASDASSPLLAPPATEARAASAAYATQATAQLAQIVATPADSSSVAYFEDLDTELRAVLTAQLRRPGDVSALIETSTAFLVFVAREKTSATLAVSAFSLPKRAYETWLAEPLVPTP